MKPWQPYSIVEGASFYHHICGQITIRFLKIYPFFFIIYFFVLAFAKAEQY
ncbi:hypothetical protein DDD_1816 [Nonlabens dokdonensis DSW-6]|uniref:Uncharacterized protein n=1 Tax=Nonlabens dokdonensis (strain DSM 17205 / KCTC 12402 / DSW-6) TaxID=592029 RepID=L7WDH6_NONDD|nr:hypothetical protein DDD_1816 [Nonlabens dokdonensis DSW-6]